MSTTQIPPPTSSTPPSRRPPGGDLYDASNWESAYRELHDAPALLIQLQDDLSKSRRREAFWISVAVHLVVVLLLVNSDKLARLMPRGTGVVVSPSLSKDKDVTFLELPPDAQKVAKRPDTNIISDKDRVATSKAPQLDRQELKKILDASRAGRPGPPAAQQPSAPDQTMAQGPPAPQQQGSPPPPQNPNLTARLQTPPAGSPNPFANAGAMSPGAAINQAARATVGGHGGFAGDNGDFGLGQGKQGRALGQLDVLSDTMGVDFGPYLQRVLRDVKLNWYNLIPESARAPLMKKGKVAIEFAILKDGKVAGLKLVSTSGDVALDRGAWGGITASNPFPPLPSEFGGQYLALRFYFFYNPDKSDLQ